MENRNYTILLANIWSISQRVVYSRDDGQIVITDPLDEGTIKRIDTASGSVTTTIPSPFGRLAMSESVRQFFRCILVCPDWSSEWIAADPVARAINEILPPEISSHLGHISQTAPNSEQRLDAVTAMMDAIDRYQIDQIYLDRIPAANGLSQ